MGEVGGNGKRGKIVKNWDCEDLGWNGAEWGERGVGDIKAAKNEINKNKSWGVKNGVVELG